MGFFKKSLLYLLLIIVHELGHFLTGKLFNWEVDKIYIYPLGGITKFNTSINKPMKEELMVTIMGPVFQIIFYCLIKDLDNSLGYFNSLLLTFNLLPVVPLDGSKLLNILLSTRLSFKKVLNILQVISLLIYPLIVIFFSYKINSLFMLTVSFLLIFKILEEGKNIKYIINKFLLERYLKRYKFKKDIIVKNIASFYKYKNNIIINNKIMNEKEALYNYFNNKRL